MSNRIIVFIMLGSRYRYIAKVSFRRRLTVLTPVTPVFSILAVLWQTLNRWGWTESKLVSNTNSRSELLGIFGTNSSLFITSQM